MLIRDSLMQKTGKFLEMSQSSDEMVSIPIVKHPQDSSPQLLSRNNYNNFEEKRAIAEKMRQNILRISETINKKPLFIKKNKQPAENVNEY
jgi:hypothetical protein